MASTSGSVKGSINITEALAAGATRPAVANVVFQFDKSTAYVNGTTAGAASRVYYFSGSAIATPTVINLSTIVAIDGGVGFTHIRELWVFNDATADGSTLILGGGTTPFQPMLAGTTPTLTINPGSFYSFSKPLGTTGFAVSTTINLKLDPTAATVPFRVFILGSGS